MIYWIIASAGILIAAALSIPVKIYLKSNLVCLIQWLFLRLIIRARNNAVTVELRVFENKYPLKKKEPLEDPPVRKTSRSGKKNYFSIFKSAAKDRKTRGAFYKLCRLLFRFVRAFRIILFKCNIGLKDYYWQGIITGWLCALPANDNFRVNGNFTEVNNFILGLRLSLWKTLAALIVLIACFPYLRAFRFYRKVVNSK